MGSSVWIATARCGLDGAEEAGGFARRTRQGRSAAEDGGGAAILFRDAKARRLCAPAENSRPDAVAATRGASALYPLARSSHRAGRTGGAAGQVPPALVRDPLRCGKHRQPLTHGRAAAPQSGRAGPPIGATVGRASEFVREPPGRPTIHVRLAATTLPACEDVQIGCACAAVVTLAGADHPAHDACRPRAASRVRAGGARRANPSLNARAAHQRRSLARPVRGCSTGLICWGHGVVPFLTPRFRTPGYFRPVRDFCANPPRPPRAQPPARWVIRPAAARAVSRRSTARNPVPGAPGGRP